MSSDPTVPNPSDEPAHFTESSTAPTHRALTLSDGKASDRRPPSCLCRAYAWLAGKNVLADECNDTGLDGSVLTLATFAFTTSVLMTAALATAAESITGSMTKWVAVAVYIIIAAFPVIAMMRLLRGTVGGDVGRVRAINRPSLQVGRTALCYMMLYPVANVLFVVLGVFPGNSRKPFDQPSITCTSQSANGFQSLAHSSNEDVNRLVDYTLKSFPPDDAYVFEQMTPFKDNYDSFAVHVDVSEQRDPAGGKKMEVARAFLVNRTARGKATSIRPLHVPESNQQTSRTICVERPDKDSVVVVVFCSPGKIDQAMINLRKE